MKRYTVHSLQQNISAYVTKRARLREEMKNNPDKKDVYLVRLKKVKYKLARWRQALKYQLEWRRGMKQIADLTEIFFKVDTIRSWDDGKEPIIRGFKNKNTTMARWFFCKMAIERLKLQSFFVGDFLGAKYRYYAAHNRRKLNKMMKSDSDLMNKWVAYRKFISIKLITEKQIENEKQGN